MISKEQLKKIILPLIFINIVVFVIYVFFKQKEYQITQINIKTHETVSMFQPIIFSFNQGISPAFLDSCTVKVDPKVELDINSSDTRLIVTPHEYYFSDTKYSLTLSCQSISYTIPFSIEKVKDASEEDLAWLQIHRDKKVADELKEMFEKQPWREHFPIITDSYDLVYSQVSDAYLVRILDESDHASLESSIAEELAKIGAPDLEIIWRN